MKKLILRPIQCQVGKHPVERGCEAQLANKIVLLCICHNFSLIDKDKLVRDTPEAFIKGNNTFTPFLTIF